MSPVVLTMAMPLDGFTIGPQDSCGTRPASAAWTHRSGTVLPIFEPGGWGHEIDQEHR